MPFSPASISPARALGRRLLSRSTPMMEAAASSCPSYDVVSSSLTVGDNIQSQQSRPFSSMGRPPISQTSSKSSFMPPTYSALRNKVTMPADAKSGQPYVSPYNDFFANIEAGRTSLGTTTDMEEKSFEMEEACLECGIPESELRFITKSYGRFALAPYVSAGEHKVTVKVNLNAIPFDSEKEKEIFKEIVGSRYSHEKDQLKLSSEKFASRIENKRLLVDMIEKIVSNSRELAKEFDAEDEKTAATAN